MHPLPCASSYVNPYAANGRITHASIMAAEHPDSDMSMTNTPRSPDGSARLDVRNRVTWGCRKARRNGGLSTRPTWHACRSGPRLTRSQTPAETTLKQAAVGTTSARHKYAQNRPTLLVRTDNVAPDPPGNFSLDVNARPQLSRKMGLQNTQITVGEPSALQDWPDRPAAEAEVPRDFIEGNLTKVLD